MSEDQVGSLQETVRRPQAEWLGVGRDRSSGEFADGRDGWLSSGIEAARRHPLQALAVGLGIAYPLVRLARVIPLPLLVIGAGLYAAGSMKGRRPARKPPDNGAGSVGGYRTDRVNRGRNTLVDPTEKCRGVGVDGAPVLEPSPLSPSGNPSQSTT